MYQIKIFKNLIKVSSIILLLSFFVGFGSVVSQAGQDCRNLVNGNTMLGMQNNDVLLLQKCLRSAGTFSYPQDTGYFGQITDKALKDYLILPSKNRCLALVKINVSYGQENQDVKNLQQCLREENFFNYQTNTGYFGMLTQTALNNYKASLGLPSMSNIPQQGQTWMMEAGININDWQAVNYIVSKESGWNPNAINPYSGACGLAQASPCSKTGCQASNDPICSLKWQQSYVNARYGGYHGAYSFMVTHGWY
jgi:Transglycosylase SLT domain